VTAAPAVGRRGSERRNARLGVTRPPRFHRGHRAATGSPVPRRRWQRILPGQLDDRIEIGSPHPDRQRSLVPWRRPAHRHAPRFHRQLEPRSVRIASLSFPPVEVVDPVAGACESCSSRRKVAAFRRAPLPSRIERAPDGNRRPDDGEEKRVRRAGNRPDPERENHRCCRRDPGKPRARRWQRHRGKRKTFERWRGQHSSVEPRQTVSHGGTASVVDEWAKSKLVRDGAQLTTKNCSPTSTRVPRAMK
jgi:hypothetical protein